MTIVRLFTLPVRSHRKTQVIKSGYELLQGDPSDMLLWQTTTQTERVVVLLARTERLTPLIGFIGNGVSLWINLKPEFTIQWETQ